MRIAFLTESRSEWGAIFPVVREAKKRGHDGFVYYAGEHVARKTWDVVFRDCLSIGEGYGHYHSRVFHECKHAWFVINGDRWGLMFAVMQAYRDKVGIAHLSGGDAQAGYLVDEPVRHAVSKFATVHFPVMESSQRRLLAMGEREDRIHLVGSTLVDDLREFKPVKKSYCKYILVQMHPAPHWQEDLRGIIANLQKDSWRLIVMQPNTDEGYGRVPDGIKYMPNMPRADFLQLLWNAAVFIGNSSALFLEAQYLGVPCVHIGGRNRSRALAFVEDIIFLPTADSDAVLDGAKVAMAQFDYRTETGLRENWQQGAHGDGTAAQKILDVLEEIGVPDEKFKNKGLDYL